MGIKFVESGAFSYPLECFWRAVQNVDEWNKIDETLLEEGQSIDSKIKVTVIEEKGDRTKSSQDIVISNIFLNQSLASSVEMKLGLYFKSDENRMLKLKVKFKDSQIEELEKQNLEFDMKQFFNRFMHAAGESRKSER